MAGVPGDFQTVVHTTEPQPIPRELLEDPDLTAQLLLQAETNNAEASSAAATSVLSTPVGLQQTFERGDSLFRAIGAEMDPGQRHVRGLVLRRPLK